MTEEVDEAVILEKAKHQLKNFYNDHLAELKNVKVTQVVEYGLAIDAIKDTVNRQNIDLIVMGTKGADSIETKLIGSNTLRVIEKAACPVLTIPEKSRFRRFNRIAFAIDYRDSDIESIILLSAFASLFKAEIILVHVAEFFVPSTYENALFDVFVDDVKKNVFYKDISFKIMKGVSKSKTFNEFVEEENIDLIAIVTRKKNIFIKMFNSSFTRKVAYHTHLPLLAFHTK
jgi:nucleotide-binding universal stress UspA family protein